MDISAFITQHFYTAWFVLLCLLNGIFILFTYKAADSGKSKAPQVVTADFQRFQRNYVIIYLLVMMADWLQGPYTYALYKSYGYDISAIGTLFLVGFGTSMVLGAYVGGFSDLYGRRLMCLIFTVFYGVSCLTKHSPNFYVLLFGRFLGGICTSILMSCFEAWLVHEHRARHHPEEWLGLTMAVTSQGNGIVAIVAGVLGQLANSQFGPVGPFDLSLVFLVIAGLMIAHTWTENTGEYSASSSVTSTLSSAIQVLKDDTRMFLIGVIQSCFEGPMYVFVFMWTPALESTSAFPVSHGMVFASFMLACFIGSGVFKSLHTANVPLETIMTYLLSVSAVTLIVPAVSQSHILRLVAFCVFEVCCGLFWPTAGTLRARYVPEDLRATITNIFRIPLNLIVIAVLGNLGKFSEGTVFTFASGMLCVAVVAQLYLVSLVQGSAGSALAAHPHGAAKKGPEEVALVPTGSAAASAGASAPGTVTDSEA